MTGYLCSLWSQRHGHVLAVSEHRPPEAGVSTLHPASLGRHLHSQAPVLRILWSRYMHSNYHVSVLTNSSVNLGPCKPLLCHCFTQRWLPSTPSHSGGSTPYTVEQVHPQCHVSVHPNQLCLPVKTRIANVTHSYGWHLRTDRSALAFDAGYR